MAEGIQIPLVPTILDSDIARAVKRVKDHLLGSGGAKIGAAMGTALTGVAPAVQQLQDSLGPIGAGASAAKTGISVGAEVGAGVATALGLPELGVAIEAVSGVARAAIDQFMMLADSVAGFVAKGSPGTVRIWQQALDDVQGVIGQRLVPVLQLMTEAVRFFGDLMVEVMPSVDEVSEALQPMREAFDYLKTALADIAPIIKMDLLNVFKVLSAVVAQVTKGFAVLIRWLSDFLGITGMMTVKEGASHGAAGASASFMGFEEVSKAATQAAAQQGGQATPSENFLSKIADNTSSALPLLELLKDVAEGIKDFVNNPVKTGAKTGMNLAKKLIGM